MEITPILPEIVSIVEKKKKKDQKQKEVFASLRKKGLIILFIR